MEDDNDAAIRKLRMLGQRLRIGTGNKFRHISLPENLAEVVREQFRKDKDAEEKGANKKNATRGKSDSA